MLGLSQQLHFLSKIRIWNLFLSTALHFPQSLYGAQQNRFANETAVSDSAGGIFM
jgi:hypothetical protein